LWQPIDVTWDAAGNIFVLDAWEGGVRKFDPKGRLLTATANTSPEALKNPHSIAADASGNIYVSDGTKARIQVYDNALAFKASYDTVGSPWALCISPGPHQYLYSGENRDRLDFAPPGDGTILKLELDGTIVGRIGRPDNPQGAFPTPHHISCRVPNELLVISSTRGDWGGTIKLEP
jgi:DNA-binding beta-propeller fold protein YncE